VKGFVYGCMATVFACGTSVSVIAARHVPTVKNNVFVGQVSVGGLTNDEAARKVRLWWETEKIKQLKLHVADLKTELPPETPGQLGVTVDDQASIAPLPTDDFADGVKGIIGSAPPDKQTFPLVFKANGADLRSLAKLLDKAVGKIHPASVIYEDGSIQKTPETAPEEVDLAAVPQAVIKVLPDGDSIELPLKASAKHVPDSDLDAISDVVTEYSTRFPSSNRPRCSNIRLASSKIRGIVLMPGEKFSFNGTVGRRTLRAGFKLAGVYKNGKHDVGIGGGICQVSTTLYNACLLSNLRIRQRSNHSLPVAYVPLGRDATVDYGDLDLVVQNNYSTPIAIDSHYEPGRLTFRILGKKDPALSVKIERSDIKSWDPGTDEIVDRSLRPGARHIVEKGSWGHSVTTYRLIYRNGKLMKREFLGHSTYGGQAEVLAYNPAPSVHKEPVVVGTTTPDTATSSGTPN
jgi:vancomycin resistance protein YoaR